MSKLPFIPLTAISPIDGRYREQVEQLALYFSEYALIGYRVDIEINYAIALTKKVPKWKKFDNEGSLGKLKAYIGDFHKGESGFTVELAQQVKDIEIAINHDVKAVEKFLRGLVADSELKELIHFALTSFDLNGVAQPLMLKKALHNVYMPLLENVIDELKGMRHEWDHITMLARTHGQPASPTKLGKEFGVFIERLEKQYDLLKGLNHYGKMGGAVGNFNAHVAAFPTINWPDFADKFVGSYGLERLQTTTQIEHYDDIAAIFDALKRINTILIGLDRDVWTYISMDYFKQKIKEKETGSSAMPHKINPIDWENSEGNLGLANAMFEHFSAKLPISRLQRDLSDSTVLRNVGYVMALTVIGLKSILKGTGKLLINENKIWFDLNKNVVVISEGIQTILRREGFPNSYDVLKKLTRKNKEITLEDLHEFIDSLKVSDAVKTELKQITPENYTGIYSELYSPED